MRVQPAAGQQKLSLPRECFRRKPARQLPFTFNDPSRENGFQKRPQAFLKPEIINNFSAEYAQSNAEGIPNRPATPERAGPA